MELSSTTFIAQASGISEGVAIGFYLVYAIIALSLVFFLARVLHRNGALFLRDAFDSEELAQAVNQLLVIGFYLLNLGYALSIYQIQPSYESLTFAFNELVIRIGILLLSLGVIHLANMFVFWRIRASKNRQQHVPLPRPSMMAPPPPGMVAAPMGQGPMPATAP